jgi:DNA polymerase elongation subunit (family B)
MSKKTKGRLICEDYCKAKENKELKDYTLAKKVYNENRKVFLNIEQARSYIRMIRGHYGKRLRRTTVDKEQFTATNYDTNNSKPYKEQIDTSAKILVLDIETAPLKVWAWNVWNQNIAPVQIASDWFCLTWAAKWLFEDKVFSGSVTAKEVKREDDSRIMRSLWMMLNEADIVIAHNGEKFDIPRINTRFLVHGFEPPLPYQQIDTLKHIRRQFGFVHNKLDYVNQVLKLARKQENTGMELWKRCMAGEQAALDEMLSYNIQDVRILEDTYLRIRPWIKPHPSISLFLLDEQQHRCPSCGSIDLTEQGKHYHTTANTYVLLRCGNCGANSRKRLSSLTIKQRRHLTMSVPK